MVSRKPRNAPARRLKATTGAAELKFCTPPSAGLRERPPPWASPFPGFRGAGAASAPELARGPRVSLRSDAIGERCLPVREGKKDPAGLTSPLTPSLSGAEEPTSPA